MECLPPGATLIDDFVSVGREQELLSYIDSAPWLLDLRRRVQHYGWRYDYKARRVTADALLGALPDWLQPEVGALCGRGLFDPAPDQVIVNEYEPGQGIAPHIDCVPCFGPTIASLSLGERRRFSLKTERPANAWRCIFHPKACSF